MSPDGGRRDLDLYRGRRLCQGDVLVHVAGGIPLLNADLEETRLSHYELFGFPLHDRALELDR